MREAAAEVVRRLRGAGHEAYWVGGCVRDLLLGRAPEDYDVATSARPDECAALFTGLRQVGRSFGVLHVHVGETWIEVATFRTEGPYLDGRHPSHVEFTGAREDALRRDFTVNALFMDPFDGRVTDFVGGQQDLRSGLLRCVGDAAARLDEDALRLLRAVRFACGLDFELESRTAAAVRAGAARAAGVAAERIRDELLRMLAGPDPRRAVALLDDVGLLAVVLAEVARLRGCEQSPRHHPEGDVWVHTLRMLDLMPRGDAALGLGVLLHDVGKPDARSESDGEVHFYGHERIGQAIAAGILERLRVPRRMQETVQTLIGEHMQFLQVQNMRRSTLRRFLLQDDFAALLELHRLDALSSRGDLATYAFCHDQLAGIDAAAPVLRPLLSGDVLLRLGYAPGPRLGAILRALVDAQLEGEVADAAAAEAWVRRHYAPEAPGAAESS